VDECVLALFQLTLHDNDRAWKGFDFEVLDRLFQEGYILNPRNKNKSVVLTEAGLQRSMQLFREVIGWYNHRCFSAPERLQSELQVLLPDPVLTLNAYLPSPLHLFVIIPVPSCLDR
jgi:hypothetical protein